MCSLEYIEYFLLKAGCNRFTDAEYTAAGFGQGFRLGICAAAGQEGAHSDNLGSILQANEADSNSPCTLVPYSKDPATFVNTLNAISSISIGALIGVEGCGARILMCASLLIAFIGLERQLQP